MCGGATSFLSGGDTYGVIYTNNCIRLECDPGAYLDFNASLGLIIVNTANATLKNVWIKNASGYGHFYINPATNFVTFDSCIVSDCTIAAPVTPVISFDGSGGSITAAFKNCKIYNLTLTSVDYTGFKGCYNVTNAYIDTVTIGTSGTFKGMHSCNCVTGSSIQNITTNGAIDVYYDCFFVSASIIIDCESTAAVVVSGFTNCINISACNVNGLVSGQAAAGYYGCKRISACSASSCNGTTLGVGFAGCESMSACYATSISGATHNGFESCNYGAALVTTEATNPTNDYMDSADAAITHKYSIADIFT
jgi:hypothetical protein